LGIAFWIVYYGNPGDGLWMLCLVLSMVWRLTFLIFQVHYLLKLLPTLEYVLAHRVVYDDVKRISFFGGIFSGIVIDNFYSRWSSGLA
jgi:hypothetical protein